MSDVDHKAVEAEFQARLKAEQWQEAMEVLVRHYGSEILRFLTGFLRDMQDAEEVFAELSLKLCEDIPKFRGECSGRTWFYYQARFAALAFKRAPMRKRERRLETQEMSRMSRLVVDVRSRTRPYMRTDVKDAFAELREKLSPDEETLLVLYKYQNMSSQEVAEAISSPDDPWTPAKVRKRWQRLKVKIAKLAKEQGLLDKAK